mmetsp:Transcript_32798/g.68394  ORF Transcript_32798/g.68394 Transcript_32798/m.68394 type:complete len:220 (-) Transcript_32798:167-826(-)|eukprot:CAMPEP_0172439144 /NCGR_PEP_ID=MMETSP1065-20121228/228_1 /TAXON_ID=265537 /ORGANISM="Amphiprora paludosa, Strain CCMP125" /LENGTH=219 /DNA_ID=CAMNT_0013187785 /DNA_START=314 /DNA_END=973 /DNA_ORIENTATION=-
MCSDNKVAEGEYRSPWTNNVFQKNGENGSAKNNQLDETLLDLERKFNNVWSVYTNLYYGSEAVGSCFLTETDSKNFVGIFCIHKSCSDGAWNSYHVVQIDDPNEKTCQYHVTSTVWVVVNPEHGYDDTTVDISAHLTKSTSSVMKIEKFSLDEYHLQNIGTIVEANELDMRSHLEQVHLPNTEAVMDKIQKEPETPRQVNPLMGMIMDSSLLKKSKMGQ